MLSTYQVQVNMRLLCDASLNNETVCDSAATANIVKGTVGDLTDVLARIIRRP